MPGRLLKNSFTRHCERSEAISGFEKSMTWRLLRRLRLLAMTVFWGFSAACSSDDLKPKRLCRAMDEWDCKLRGF
jgi:hypothetical protein